MAQVTLTSAQILAIVQAGGAVALPRGDIIRTVGAVPSQAALDAGTYDSQSPFDISASGGAIGTAYASGTWMGYPGTPSTGSTGGVATATFSLVPLFFPRAGTITNLQVECTSVGTTGAVARIGVYADDGTFFPGALMLDTGLYTGGSFDMTGTGVKQFDVDGASGRPATLAIPAGRIWVGAVTQGAPATPPTVRINSGPTPGIPIGTTTPTSLSAGPHSFFVGSITGALPSTWSGTRNAVTTSSYRVALKLG